MSKTAPEVKMYYYYYYSYYYYYYCYYYYLILAVTKGKTIAVELGYRCYGYCEEYALQGKFRDMISVFRASKMHLLRLCIVL